MLKVVSEEQLENLLTKDDKNLLAKGVIFLIKVMTEIPQKDFARILVDQMLDGKLAMQDIPTPAEMEALKAIMIKIESIAEPVQEPIQAKPN